MELLAHVSAPASHQDDERYRRQARNCLTFNGTKRQRLNGVDGQATTSNGIACNRDESATIDDESAEVATYIDDTQLAITVLESQVCNTSLLNDFNHSRATGHDKAVPEGYGGGASSFVGDGDPARLGSVSQRPPAELPQGSEATTTELSAFFPAANNADSAMHAPTDNTASTVEDGESPVIRRIGAAVQQSKSSSWSDDNLPYELPSTFSISDDTSKASGEQGLVPHDGEIEVTTPERPPRSTSNPETQALPIPHKKTSHIVREPAKAAIDVDAVALATTRQNEALSAQTVSSAPEQDKAAGATAEGSSAVGPDAVQSSEVPQKDVVLADKTEITRSPCLPSNFPLSVHPQPPPTSTTPEPQSFLTRTLHDLADLPLLKGRYRPTSQSRQLRNQERGYWSLHPGALGWTIGDQVEMWNMLSKIIKSGGTGWNVWMARVPKLLDGNADQDGAALVQERSLGEVKVFCWGEIAREIWLLLYVASSNKVKKARAVWCDASGTIIIRT